MLSVDAPPNTAPVTNADVSRPKKDAPPISGNVLANDSDADGNTLTVANAGTHNLQYGSLTIHADGSYTYTLNTSNPAIVALTSGQTVPDPFTYIASDGRGGETSGTLTITVNGGTGNRPPVTQPDTNTIKEDAMPNTISGNVLANDADPDDDPIAVANPGTVNLQYGGLVIRADGSFTYTLDNSNPTVDALNNGQHLSDVFTYVASDGYGGSFSDTLTIRIDGTTDNRPPIADADTNVIKEDAVPNRVFGNLLANDSDPNGHTLALTNAGTYILQYGSIEVHADGSYAYTLDNANPTVNALNDIDRLIETFTYHISDGHGGTDSSTVTITIHGTTD